MIDGAAAAVARAAADELAPKYGPRLAADIEAAIHAHAVQQAQEPATSGQYFDPVALGALIVSITQFGYQVYRDRKKNGHQTTQEEIARAIRIERRRRSNLPDEETEIIDIVSVKIIEHGGELPARRTKRYAQPTPRSASGIPYSYRRSVRIHSRRGRPWQHAP